jgi:peptidyl-tRNA hydrolase, PTH1 family
MQLVIGLGNPGSRYAATRHNVGFRCLEAVARRLDLVFDVQRPQYRAAVGCGPVGPVTLLQPLTYMNLSGEALVAWAEDSGWLVGAEPDPVPQEAIEPEAAPAAPDQEPGPDCRPTVVPVVVCDDLHLPLGSVRIRGRGSDGGQKGLASILGIVGGRGVPRLRLGVGPAAQAVPVADWADFVLQPFAPQEEEAVAEMVDWAAAAVVDLLESGWEAAASRFSRKLAP